MRLLYTRHLSGVPIKVSKHIIGIRRDGLPKGFPIMNEIFLMGTPETTSFILSMLSVSRTIKAWKPVDYSSITDEYRGRPIKERE